MIHDLGMLQLVLVARQRDKPNTYCKLPLNEAQQRIRYNENILRIGEVHSENDVERISTTRG